MTQDVAKAMEIGRKQSGLPRGYTAECLGVDERTVYRYEKGEVKREDPALIADAMALYGDNAYLIGLVYLMEHPVVIALKDLLLSQNRLSAQSCCTSCLQDELKKAS